MSEDLPDTVEEILNRPFYIDDVSLYEFLDELYNVEDLKQICRDYRIKGFSNKRKDDINEQIVETLMDPSGQLLDQLLQRDLDLKSLIASFIITDTNTLEPTNHKQRPFIIYQQDSEFITIPKEVLSRFKAYFKQHQISALKSLNKRIKKYYAFIVTESNTWIAPKNANDAIRIHNIIDRDNVTKSEYLNFLQSLSKPDVYSDFLIHVHLKGLSSQEELETLIERMRTQDIRNHQK
ncbi:hypothetical protein ACY2DA_01635 [Staphylococcus simulans]